MDEFDVVIVGSGAAGMTAALTAAKRGLTVVVVEKAPTFGGSTARSGAGIWLPNSSVLQRAGLQDTPEDAAKYLAAVVGPDVPIDRQQAFLTNGPLVLDFIMANSPLRFHYMKGYSDYSQHLPGAIADGRSIEPDKIDGKLLGPELANINPPCAKIPLGLVIYSQDYRWMNLALVNAKGLARGVKTMVRGLKAIVRRQKLLTMGPALAAGLRVGLLQANVPVWLNSPLVELVQENDAVTGVVVEKNGVRTTVHARKGVIISSGGFEHNAEMRAEYQQQPIGTQWTLGSKNNTGDGIRIGEKAGAALALMDDSFWGPTIPIPDQPYFCLAERSLPGGLLVNRHGKRFMNESVPYCEAVHIIYKQDRGDDGTQIPVWLIFDQHYRNKYMFRDILARFPFPKTWYKEGIAKNARTLQDLAVQIQVPTEALQETVTRFNEMAGNGKDLDFGRGDSPNDRYFADPNVKPNPCLAPLQNAPFYAVKIVPGDLGTRGGIVTDSRARALRKDGTVIRGLWAAGNASASVMGHGYAGAGATLGPAMTFGYIAANDIADSQ
ncbi:hypothetical protein BGZ94_000958 [Podila epigama]|nr:hypothetical protein BGZ94_000958 [Podila epigama]